MGMLFSYAGIQHRHAGKLSLNSVGLLFEFKENVYGGLTGTNIHGFLRSLSFLHFDRLQSI